MKKKKFSVIAGFSLLLVMTAATALAQNAAQATKIEIPFAFFVGNNQLPAGQYVITRNGNTMLIANTSGKGSVATLPTRTIRDNQRLSIGRLVFNRYYNQYFLSEIWMPGEGIGRELRIGVSEL